MIYIKRYHKHTIKVGRYMFFHIYWYRYLINTKVYECGEYGTDIIQGLWNGWNGLIRDLFENTVHYFDYVFLIK